MAGRKKKIDVVEEQAADEAPSGYYTPGRAFGFNILDKDDDEFSEQIMESLTGMKERRKNRPTGFKSASEIKRSMIPVRDFRMQYVLGSYGLPQGTCIEIIGGEGIGKSTLLYWLGGGAMLAGSPFAIQETEGKALVPAWAGRAMHTDPKMANKMLKRMTVFEDTFSLDQMEENMMDWFKIMREKVGVPIETPIFMGIDTWSKLMSPSEAAGFQDYGDKLSAEEKKKFKATNEGSNLVHSKWAAAFCRRLPYVLNKYNAVLLNNCHQNAKINMNPGKGVSFMSDDQKLAYNKTKIGGNAFNQNAAVQLILTAKGGAKNSDNKIIGQRVGLRVDKNSYGPRDRTMEYEIINQGFKDTDNYIEPNIRFAKDLALWMTTEKLVGTTANRGRYTCESLGVINATAEDFATAFHANTEVVHQLGVDLHISGYDHTIDKINETTKDE